jgi:hypothetical protein
VVVETAAELVVEVTSVVALVEVDVEDEVVVPAELEPTRHWE